MTDILTQRLNVTIGHTYQGNNLEVGVDRYQLEAAHSRQEGQPGGCLNRRWQVGAELHALVGQVE